MEAFPLWLRIGHLSNAILITLLIRSGIEILSAHPKLYKGDDTHNGNLFFKFTRKKMPDDKLWTSDDEMESFNSVLALPGQSHLGQGRHWHLFSILFWPLNGLIYYVLLFATGTWTTLIPKSWDIFPEAFKIFLIFLSGHLPPIQVPFDPLQQLTYAGVVFILGPLMILVGAAMSPAVGAAFPRYVGFFGGRQRVRLLHFIIMVPFSLFILVHITMVAVTRINLNMANIIFGYGEMSVAAAIGFFLLYLAIIITIHYLATLASLKRPRQTQQALGAIIEPVRKRLMLGLESKQHLQPSRITCSFRVNGRPPETDEYRTHVARQFADWRLRIDGLVETPLELSIDDLKSERRATQVTEHTCIQGWTGIAEWGGVRLSDLMKRCQPKETARWAAFHSIAYGDLDSFGHGDPTTKFYEVLPIELAYQEQTILAYEMNYKPLTVEHGAPLRLRVEVQYGYKMVKWLNRVEIIDDFRKLRAGHGGHREDSKQFDWGAWI